MKELVLEPAHEKHDKGAEKRWSPLLKVKK
jgi:hypothetical protein